eukprot:bmy_10445T0
MSNALANAVCQRCQARFAPAERIVNSNGELYHEHCFVCAQCFRPFPEGLFYEVRMLPGPSPPPSQSLSPGPSSGSALWQPVGRARPWSSCEG